MSSNRNKRLLYALTFFHSLIPAYTIERLFWQSRGVDVAGVVWCEIIYAVTIVCLELPSGLLADRWGRKRLIVADALLSFAEIVIITFAQNFWHFAIAIFLTGCGAAFSSGAVNALLYDSLAHSGQAETFEKTLGRMGALDFASSVLAALCGGVLAARLGMEFNYYLSIVSLGVCVCIAFWIAEPPRAACGEHAPSLRAVMHAAAVFFRSHAGMLKLLCSAAAVAACITYVYEFWQLYLERISFPVAWYGAASALLSVAVIPASLAAGTLARRLGHRRLVLFASLVCGLGILTAALSGHAAGLAGFALACAANAVMAPTALGYLHRRADDSARATIESAVSLAERAAGIALGLPFGYIAAAYGIPGGFLFLGALILLVSAYFAFSRAPKEEGDGAINP